MRTYDQIIFDELAAGRSVMLEEVGCLNIDNIPAQVTRKKTITAPRKVVVFTADANSDSRNAINIFESEGVDHQQARDQYYAWLAEAHKDGKLTIKGAGALKDKIFTPSAELNNALNPNAKDVDVKSGSKTWLWILLAVIALVLLAFILCRNCSGVCENQKEHAKVEVVDQPQTPVDAVPDSAALARAREAELAALNAQNDAANGLNYPVAGRYYVVAGVFDIPSNADNLISLLKPYLPDLAYEKFDYPGVRPGRTMVTVFSSANYTETLNMRRQLAWNHDLYDLWIYPEAK